MKRTHVILTAALAAAICAGAVLAEVVQENYAPVRNHSNQGAPAAYRTALSSDDSATTTTPIDPQDTAGDGTIVVEPSGSAAAGTVTVEVWLYHSNGAGTYTWMGIAGVQTATFGSLRRIGASGNYPPLQPLVFSSYGADAYDVRIRSVSSGTVDLRAWTAGAAGKAAE